MKVHFEKPIHGWLEFTIQDNGNSFHGDADVCISYENEPHYVLIQWLDDSKFRIAFDKKRIPIACSSDNETLATFKITGKELCIAFWRGLKDLEGKTTPEDFADHWGGEFPSSSLLILTNLIKSDREQS